MPHTKKLTALLTVAAAALVAHCGFRPRHARHPHRPRDSRRRLLRPAVRGDHQGRQLALPADHGRRTRGGGQLARGLDDQRGPGPHVVEAGRVGAGRRAAVGLFPAGRRPTAAASMPSTTTTATTSSARAAATAWAGSSTSTRTTTGGRGRRSVTACPCG